VIQNAPPPATALRRLLETGEVVVISGGRCSEPSRPGSVRVASRGIWNLAFSRKHGFCSAGLVFPNTDGKIEWQANIIDRAWIPLQISAGV
jgi:hypothetical protein